MEDLPLIPLFVFLVVLIAIAAVAVYFIMEHYKYKTRMLNIEKDLYEMDNKCLVGREAYQILPNSIEGKEGGRLNRAEAIVMSMDLDAFEKCCIPGSNTLDRSLKRLELSIQIIKDKKLFEKLEDYE